MSASLTQAIEDMRTMRESYDQIGAAAEAYNTGKVQLAAAITSKGVETSPTESYPEMAEKVNAISQETYEINGGEMYAKQLYGVKDNSIVPGYWNLYEVMAYLLTKTSAGQYSILLCEFPKGDAQYVFGTAVSANSIPVGYVFSDDWQINGEGSLNIHANTESAHVWNDDLDMKGNRWVAWLFAQVVEGAAAPTVSLGAAATNCPQPRSIHIGRHMGTITATTNGTMSEIVVTDGNVLDGFVGGSYTQNFGKSVVIKNLSNQSETLIYNSPNTEKVYVSAESISGNVFDIYNSSSLNTLIVDSPVINGTLLRVLSTQGLIPIKQIITKVETGTFNIIPNGGICKFSNLKDIYINSIKNVSTWYNPFSDAYQPNSLTLHLSYNDDYDKNGGFGINNSVYYNTNFVQDVVLQNGWCMNLHLRSLKNLSKENVQAHIFDRLGVNDLSTGAVTITLASAVLNLFTQEEIDAVVERTNITIVGA